MVTSVHGPLCVVALVGNGCPAIRLSVGLPRRNMDCNEATSDARRSSLDLTSLSLSGTVGTVGPVHSAPNDIPESRSSLEPSLSQGGDALGPGSCFIPCNAKSALAASLSPIRDLCLSLWGRLLLAEELTINCGPPSSPLPEDNSKGDWALRPRDKFNALVVSRCIAGCGYGYWKLSVSG